MSPETRAAWKYLTINQSRDGSHTLSGRAVDRTPVFLWSCGKRLKFFFLYILHGLC